MGDHIERSCERLRSLPSTIHVPAACPAAPVASASAACLSSTRCLRCTPPFFLLVFGVGLGAPAASDCLRSPRLAAAPKPLYVIRRLHRRCCCAGPRETDPVLFELLHQQLPIAFRDLQLASAARRVFSASLLSNLQPSAAPAPIPTNTAAPFRYHRPQTERTAAVLLLRSAQVSFCCAVDLPVFAINGEGSANQADTLDYSVDMTI